MIRYAVAALLGGLLFSAAPATAAPLATTMPVPAMETTSAVEAVHYRGHRRYRHRHYGYRHYGYRHYGYRNHRRHYGYYGGPRYGYYRHRGPSVGFYIGRPGVGFYW